MSDNKLQVIIKDSGLETAKADAERKILEVQNRIEREKQAQIEKQKREKLIADRQAEIKANRKIQENLQAEIKAQKAKDKDKIECPYCHRLFKLGGEK